MPPTMLPMELLLDICRHADWQELKSFRLLGRRLLNLAAEEILFRDVILERNIESSFKLMAIAHSPGLRRHVKRLIYRGRHMMLYPGAFRDILQSRRHWFPGVLYHYRGLLHDFQAMMSIFTTTLPPTGFIVDRYETREIDLVEAFRNFDMLKEFVLEPLPALREDHGYAAKQEFTINTAAGCLPLGYKEWDEKASHASQMNAILSAAGRASRRIQTFKAMGLPDLDHCYPRTTRTPRAFMRDCTEFTLDFHYHSRHVGNRSTMFFLPLAFAPRIRSMDLAFGELSKKENMDLACILRHNVHWRYLKSLRLHALTATQRLMERFLALHRETLRSLTLSDIVFTNLYIDPSGNITYDSWVSFIMFLQGTMELQSMTFEPGIISNNDDETWVVAHPIGHYPELIPTLKSRIENFVVKKGGQGGQCPLRVPTEYEHGMNSLQRWAGYSRWYSDSSWCLYTFRE